MRASSRSTILDAMIATGLPPLRRLLARDQRSCGGNGNHEYESQRGEHYRHLLVGRGKSRAIRKVGDEGIWPCVACRLPRSSPSAERITSEEQRPA
jgi:hypothetical protein